MKLINYRYGGVIPQSSTWYNGRIVMSEKEWCDCIGYLLRSTAWYESYYPHMPRILREDVAKMLSLKGGGKRVAIRVSATEAIVKRYHLPRYKRQNYFIDIIA